MKRLLTLMLALALALSLCVAANAEVYTHPEAGYGFNAPEGWMVLDGSTTSNLLDLGTGLLDLSDDILAMLDQAKDMPMALVISPNLMNNIAVTMEDAGMEIPPALLLMLGDTLFEQYQTIFPGFVVTAPMSQVDFGEWKAAMFDGEYEMAGMRFALRQVFVPSGTYLFGFVLTVNGGAVEEYAPVLTDLVTSFFVP